MSGNRPEHIAPPEVVSLSSLLLSLSLFTPQILTFLSLSPYSFTMQEKHRNTPQTLEYNLFKRK